MTADADTEQLLDRAAAGDAAASYALLDRHRPRLKRMIAVRMDDRLAARFDPSDVVQETLADAARRLPEYLSTRAVAFYPWLRRLAQQQLVDLHRHHRASRRNPVREDVPPLPDRSADDLARRLLSPRSGPSGAALRRETRDRVRAALDTLDPQVIRTSETLFRYREEELPRVYRSGK